ncbi:MAG: methyltransferase domain-containing protein [Candidatus Omnitrophota bacterium]
MHPNSKLLFEKYAKPLFKSHMRVLEIGPDKCPSTHREAVKDDTIKWETLDIFASPGLTYVADDEYKFPVPEDTFDIVLSAQVIEHVRKIWVWIKELARVCKSGGRVITICPVSWHHHEFPVDCWRIYSGGMRVLYEEAGLTVKLCRTETLEVPGYKRVIPGKSYKPGKGNFKLLVRKLFGCRITCAFDTIAIGTKP